jgi:hypothetical protein
MSEKDRNVIASGSQRDRNAIERTDREKDRNVIASGTQRDRNAIERSNHPITLRSCCSHAAIGHE